MKRQALWGTFSASPVLFLIFANAGPAVSEPASMLGNYKLLAPISHRDLTIFPVVTSKSTDTSGFLTLDEGIKSGEVVVTEVGNVHGMMSGSRTHRGTSMERR